MDFYDSCYFVYIIDQCVIDFVKGLLLKDVRRIRSWKMIPGRNCTEEWLTRKQDGVNSPKEMV